MDESEPGPSDHPHQSQQADEPCLPSEINQDRQLNQSGSNELAHNEEMVKNENSFEGCGTQSLPESAEKELSQDATDVRLADDDMTVRNDISAKMNQPETENCDNNLQEITDEGTGSSTKVTEELEGSKVDSPTEINQPTINEISINRKTTNNSTLNEDEEGLKNHNKTNSDLEIEHDKKGEENINCSSSKVVEDIINDTLNCIDTEASVETDSLKNESDGEVKEALYSTPTPKSRAKKVGESTRKAKTPDNIGLVETMNTEKPADKIIEVDGDDKLHSVQPAKPEDTIARNEAVTLSPADELKSKDPIDDSKEAVNLNGLVNKAHEEILSEPVDNANMNKSNESENNINETKTGYVDKVIDNVAQDKPDNAGDEVVTTVSIINNVNTDKTKVHPETNSEPINHKIEDVTTTGETKAELLESKTPLNSSENDAGAETNLNNQIDTAKNAVERYDIADIAVKDNLDQSNPPSAAPRRSKNLQSVTNASTNRDSYHETKAEIEESLSFIKSKLSQPPSLPPANSKSAPASSDAAPPGEENGKSDGLEHKQQQKENPDYEPISTAEPVYEMIPPSAEEAGVDEAAKQSSATSEEKPVEMVDSLTRGGGGDHEFSLECVPPVRPVRAKKPAGKLEVPSWRPPSQSIIKYLFGCFQTK